jgi:ABC-2 type transport system ATP-binding protein
MERERSIVVRDLVKRFGHFAAVDGVSFDVEKGEIFGFLGANGAGKSTTIRMLCGLLRPTSGTAVVAGHDVKRDPEKVKERIGYMSQKFSLYGDLTVDQNITFFGGVYKLPSRKIEQRRGEVKEILDLVDKGGDLAGELPRGFQQRLAFACAILHEPDIIFLDEPTGGVDPLQRRNFWDLIYDFSAGGVTIFVTTHFLDEAEFCHRISLISAGKLVAVDAPADFKKALSQFDIFEVECEPAVAALQAMQKEDWAAQASIFGSTIHVSVPRGGNQDERIRAALARRGIAVSRIERIEPSLEDVFLYLVEDRGT